MYWIIGLVGALLFMAPFILGFSANIAAMWTCIILGGVVALLAGYKAVMKDETKWEVVVAGIAGVLAVLTPFLLGFNSNATAMWTSIILGAVVAALAGWDYFQSDKTTKTA